MTKKLTQDLLATAPSRLGDPVLLDTLPGEIEGSQLVLQFGDSVDFDEASQSCFG